jgi:hypothetical protein
MEGKGDIPTSSKSFLAHALPVAAYTYTYLSLRTRPDFAEKETEVSVGRVNQEVLFGLILA